MTSAHGRAWPVAPWHPVIETHCMVLARPIGRGDSETTLGREPFCREAWGQVEGSRSVSCSAGTSVPTFQPAGAMHRAPTGGAMEQQLSNELLSERAMTDPRVGGGDDSCPDKEAGAG